MSRSAVFVDTSAFYALADASDAAHRVAARQWEALIRAKAPLVTSLPIVAEAATLIRRWLGFDAAQRFLGQVDRSRVVGALELVFVGEREFALGEDFYRKFPDPKLSFVDVLSFAVMTARGIRTCFTFDRDFQQAGFEVLE